MSITSYMNNGSYNYREWQQFSASNASGASGCSGCSGASGVFVEKGTVESLDIREVMVLFSKGNLEKAEIEKWIDAHTSEITNYQKTETDNLLKYEFSFGGKNYTISCNKTAAASQTDNKTQLRYTEFQLKNIYKFSNEEFAQYFDIASSDGQNIYYAIKPEYNCNNINELKSIRDEIRAKLAEEAIKAEETTNTDTEAGKTDDIVLSFDNIESPEVIKNYIQTYCPEEFASGNFDDETCELIGRLAKIYSIQYANNGVDEDTLVQYAIEAMATLVNMASALRMPVDEFLEYNLDNYAYLYIQSKLYPAEQDGPAMARGLSGNSTQDEFLSQIKAKYGDDVTCTYVYGTYNVYKDKSSDPIATYEILDDKSICLYDGDIINGLEVGSRRTIYKPDGSVESHVCMSPSLLSGVFYSGDVYSTNGTENMLNYLNTTLSSSSMEADNIINIIDELRQIYEGKKNIKVSYIEKRIQDRVKNPASTTPQEIYKNTLRGYSDDMIEQIKSDLDSPACKAQLANVISKMCENMGDVDYIKGRLSVAGTQDTSALFEIAEMVQIHIKTQSCDIEGFPCVIDNSLFETKTGQADVGDCGILAALQVLATNTEFLGIMEECVKFDGLCYTVSVAGHTYTFSRDEVANAHELVGGSGSVRALTMALAIENNKYGSKTTGDYTYEGNWFSNLTYLLTRQNNLSVLYDEGTYKVDTLKAGIKNATICCNASLYDYEGDDCYSTGFYATDLLTGKQVQICGQHAYQVAKMDDKYVYLINPWYHDGKSFLQIPIDVFSERFKVDVTDINAVNQAIKEINNLENTGNTKTQFLDFQNQVLEFASKNQNDYTSQTLIQYISEWLDNHDEQDSDKYDWTAMTTEFSRLFPDQLIVNPGGSVTWNGETYANLQAWSNETGFVAGKKDEDGTITFATNGDWYTDGTYVDLTQLSNVDVVGTAPLIIGNPNVFAKQQVDGIGNELRAMVNALLLSGKYDDPKKATQAVLDSIKKVSNAKNQSAATQEGLPMIISDISGGDTSLYAMIFNQIEKEQAIKNSPVTTEMTDSELGTGYRISEYAKETLASQIEKLVDYPNAQELADAIRNGFVPKDLLNQIDPTLSDIFNQMKDMKTLTVGNSDNEFNGFLLANGGGDMLKNVVKQITSTGLASEKMITDYLVGKLSLTAGTGAMLSKEDIQALINEYATPEVVTKHFVDQAQNLIEKNRAQIQEFKAKQDDIMNDKSLSEDERRAKLAELADKIDDTQKMIDNVLKKYIINASYKHICDVICKAMDATGMTEFLKTHDSATFHQMNFADMAQQCWDMYEQDEASGMNFMQCMMRMQDRMEIMKKMYNTVITQDQWDGYMDDMNNLKSYDWLADTWEFYWNPESDDYDILYNDQYSWERDEWHTNENSRFKNICRESSWYDYMLAHAEYTGFDEYGRATYNFNGTRIYPDEADRLRDEAYAEMKNVENEILDAQLAYYDAVMGYGAESIEAAEAMQRLNDLNKYWYSGTGTGELHPGLV